MNSNAFITLQDQFQNYVLKGDGDILHCVAAGPRLNAQGRLDVYANGYRLRLIEVLDADYPALHVLAGDDLFDRLARAYIAAHPSVFPNARWFGQHLPDFLARNADFNSRPVLAEMAKFEWAMGLAFDSADDAVLEIDALAHLPNDAWATIGFNLHTAVQRVELAWNVPAFWHSVTREEDPPTPVRSPESAPWIVWRRVLTTYFRSLEPDEAAALNVIADNGNFADMCETLCDWHTPEEVPVLTMTLLKRWIDEGLIGSLRLAA